jgi:hypothetical protein
VAGNVKVKLTPIMTTANFALWMSDKTGESWSTERAREWLLVRGMLVDFGNGRYCTTKNHLMRTLPHLFSDAELMEVLGES